MGTERSEKNRIAGLIFIDSLTILKNSVPCIIVSRIRPLRLPFGTKGAFDSSEPKEKNCLPDDKSYTAVI